MKTYLILFSSLLLLGGCASKGPVFGTDFDEGTVVTPGASQDSELLYRNEVRQVIRDHAPVILDCYSPIVEKDPKTEGKLVVVWTLKPDGHVQSAAFDKTKTTLQNQPLIDCVLAASKTWIFPNKKKEVESVTISYPFVFANPKAHTK